MLKIKAQVREGCDLAKMSKQLKKRETSYLKKDIKVKLTYKGEIRQKKLWKRNRGSKTRKRGGNLGTNVKEGIYSH